MPHREGGARNRVRVGFEHPHRFRSDRLTLNQQTGNVLKERVTVGRGDVGYSALLPLAESIEGHTRHVACVRISRSLMQIQGEYARFISHTKRALRSSP